MEFGVGDEFGEIKTSLRDHPIASDVLETVTGSSIIKPVVDGRWGCGVRARFDRLFAFGGYFGLFGWLGCGLGLAFVAGLNHG
jgi:hypothetical protein